MISKSSPTEADTPCTRNAAPFDFRRQKPEGAGRLRGIKQI